VVLQCEFLSLRLKFSTGLTAGVVLAHPGLPVYDRIQGGLERNLLLLFGPMCFDCVSRSYDFDSMTYDVELTDVQSLHLHLGARNQGCPNRVYGGSLLRQDAKRRMALEKTFPASRNPTCPGESRRWASGVYQGKQSSLFKG
jgi:hypothetical protein